ncbi:M20/M25/M40 family metallo-hydrolase [Larkinella ripae]
MTDLFTTSSIRQSLVLLLAILGLCYWSIHLMQPPTARPATAPRTEFSAERAMGHLRQIARQPHASGTPDHPRVRAYLLAALRGLGLQPQVQEATVVVPPTKPASLPTSGAVLSVASRAGYVYNVMARLKGRQSGKSVLVLAHYDSQPNTLGAADDGAGVVAILEAVRALRQSDPLQHDLIVLFTDGEENGLFGARAFLRHPWAKDVGFVINLESRGNRGPSLLFEMSEQNGWIVEHLAQAMPHPLTSSLMYTIYRLLPNNTDFTPLREAGYAGVNAAFLDGFVHYHKLTDSPQNLDQNGLQHHGETMLALVQHFANGSLDQVRAPDKVFFNGFGTWLVHYPMSLNGFWIALLTATLILVLMVSRRQKQLTFAQFLGGFGLSLLLLIMLGGACWGINLGVVRALPYWHFFNGTYGAHLFFGAYLLLTVGLFGVLIRLFLRWLRPLALVLSAYGLVFVLTGVLAVWLPAGSYFLLFPLLGALLGMVFLTWLAQRQPHPLTSTLFMLLSACPTIGIVLPMAYLLFITFDLQLPVASVVLLSLFLLLLLPQWLAIDGGLRWRKASAVTLVSLLSGAALLGFAIYHEAPSDSQPLHTQTAYYLNADTKRAFWASYSLERPDPWNRQFFTNPSYGQLTEVFPNGHLVAWNSYLRQPARPIDVAPPGAELLTDSTRNGHRYLTLRLHSVRGAAHLEAVLFPGMAGRINSLSVNGEALPIQTEQTPDGPAYDMLFTGLPLSKQLMLHVDATVGHPVGLRLYDQSIGLPNHLIQRPQPASVVPEQGRRSNVTVVGKRYQF